jgi:hypothetical protein
MGEITVSIPDLRDVEYHEYLCTGFAILEALGEIGSFRAAYRGDIFHQDLDGLDWTCHLWKVDFGGRTVTFATHVSDHPDVYSQKALEACDLYFKCQCPVDPAEGVYRLSSRVSLPLPPYVAGNAGKIRPLLIARPLSRRYDFNKNLEMLADFAAMRTVAGRPQNLLAYLGVSIDTMYPDSPDIDDVHFKRVRMLLHLWNNRARLPGMKFMFRVPSHCEHLTHLLPPGWEALPRVGPVTDRMYLHQCARSKATLNTMGIAGSNPFRLADAFLTGMVCLTDRMAARWPVMPRHMAEILEIGALGYEPLPEEDWKGAMERLEAFILNMDALRAKILPAQNAFFEKWLTPQALARYVLEECRKAA